MTKKQKRAEKKAEEKRAVAEMEEAMRQDAPKEPGKDSGVRCPRCGRPVEKGVCPKCGKVYIPMDGQKVKTIRLIVGAVLVVAFVVFMLVRNG